jgi:hypothetical protein
MTLAEASVSQAWARPQSQVGCQATSLWLLILILILIFLSPRTAERRFCAVGNPAWMPG